MTRILTLASLFILILGLAACAPNPTPGAPSGGANPADLLGQEWSLVELNGAAPLAGSVVTLKLENGEAGGKAGCNSYGGKYSLQGANLSFQDVFQTEMACMDPAGVMEQETAFLQTLSQAASFALAGDRLEIKNAAGETVLIFSK